MLPILLGLYFVDAFIYAALCGLVGKTYHPLASYQVYAIGCLVSLALLLTLGRLTKLWNWRRLWPPTWPETQAALASLIILSCSTLGLLFKASLLTVLAMKCGRLYLTASRKNWLVLVLATLSVVLASLGKPVRAAALPLLLAAGYVFGYWWKLRAARSNTEAKTNDFLAAEQVIVQVLMLAVGGVFAQFTPSAPITDPRLWGIALTSLGAGLFSTAILLIAARRHLLHTYYPAYSMASLLAALGASTARGEDIGVTGTVATILALIVVFVSTAGHAIRHQFVGVTLWCQVITRRDLAMTPICKIGLHALGDPV